MSVYRVVKRLWSLARQRDLEPGEELIIEDPDEAGLLLERGCIAPAEYDWRAADAAKENHADVR